MQQERILTGRQHSTQKSQKHTTREGSNQHFSKHIKGSAYINKTVQGRKKHNY